MGADNERKRNAGVQLLVGFRGLSLEEELKSIIRHFRVGGIVLYKRNVQSPEQLKNLLEEAQAFSREALGRSLLVAVDQEGGEVQRLIPPFTQLPSARDLADQGPLSVIEWSTRAAQEMRQIGIHVNLAPVLDVLEGTPSHFMASRCLGSDPSAVAQLGRLWIESLQENGISATAKHYPGLGQAESDPHHFAPVIRWQSSEAMERDLLPFREAIHSGVHCIMTSHALYPSLDADWPATLSRTVNNHWLRNKLQFEGVLLSDDMDMAAVSARYTWDEMARQGLQATIDFFLLCQRLESIETFYRALRNGIDGDRLMADLHASSLRRIEGIFRRHGL